MAPVHPWYTVSSYTIVLQFRFQTNKRTGKTK